MLSALVLALVFGLVAGAVVVAIRDWGRTQRELAIVLAGIDERTKSDEWESEGALSADDVVVPEELGALLDEALQVEQQGLAVMAVGEIAGRAGLARARARSLTLGLSRISLLSGGGGAFAVAALGSFGDPALLQAGISVVAGVLGSLVCRSFSSRSFALAKRYVELADVLAVQVTRQFRDQAHEDGAS